MSELLQSGHHPDADQLNAFVEHALPVHEQQQTLAHLAICADCRAIVSLSLPQVEESPTPQPEPVRKRWFSSWNLAWPTAAALTGLVLFLIHIHNVTSSQGNAAPPAIQMAVSHPPTPLPPTPLPAPTSKAQTLNPHPAAAKKAAKAANPQTAGAGTDTQSIAALSIHGRNFADLQQSRPASPTGVVHGSLRTPSSGGAVGFSTGAGSALPPAPAVNTLDHLQQNAFRAATVSPIGQSVAPAPTTPAAAPAMTLRQSDTAAAPAAAATTVEAKQGNETVEVINATPGAVVSATNRQLVFDQAKTILAQHPLPSHLPVLSVASNARRTLAIDTRNALFFSDDDGKHWKAIPSQWQGRAVKVDMASSTPVSRQNFAAEISNAHPASDFAAISKSVSSSSRATNSTLTGMVTDASGAFIRGASVVVSDATTPVVRTVTTDDTGRYRVDQLIPGSYQVAAEAPGFNKQQLAVTLTASQQGVVNIILPIGQSAETVTVDASAMQVEGRPLDGRKIPEPQPVANQPLPLFEITTDTGEHWTSIDGQTWKRK
jgi:hypothetical protein